MSPLNAPFVVPDSIIDETELVEYCVKEFARKAQCTNVEKKRELRFNFLIELQSFFLRCDPKYVIPIINGLISQVHGKDYRCFIVGNIKTIRMTDKIPITCLTCLHHTKDEKTSTFLIRLLDALLPLKNSNVFARCLRCGASGIPKSERPHWYRRSITADYIANMEQRHGDRFDGRLIKYVNSRSNRTSEIEIICRTCRDVGYVSKKTNRAGGVFIRRASEHIRCVGCPLCFEREWGERTRKFMADPEIKRKQRESKLNRDRTRPACVYYLKIDRGNGETPLFKVGFTSRDINKRISELYSNNPGFTITKLLECWFENGRGAEDLETSLLVDPDTQRYLYKPNHRTKNNPGPAYVLRNGCGDNELFTADIMKKVPRIGRLMTSLASNNAAVLDKINVSYDD